MKLSEIRSKLREIRVSPVKTLGQNFLHDQNLARWIVDQAAVEKTDYVIEVGPGLGALTEHVLAQGATVLAIERDPRLVEFLRAHYSSEKFEVVHADALKFDPRIAFAHRQSKLIGNLPYNIAGEILRRFLVYPTPFSLVVLMLQKEMAERLSAVPSTKNYGALTLQIQFYYRVKYLRAVPPDVFFPRPDVASAIVMLKPRPDNDLPICDFNLFAELVRCGFSQRRKQLGKLLRHRDLDWEKIASHLGVEVTARAETLSLEHWVLLVNLLRPIPVSDAEKTAQERFPVVDNEDTVLRSARRGEVHGNNLRHRAVHILIFNAAGEILLQKRSRWKDRHPRLWDSSAAGHVDADEDYDAAAKRELKEELGIDVPLCRVTKLPASDRTGQEFIWLYRGEHDGGFSPSLAEIEAVEFFPPEIVSRWIAARPDDFAPGFVECWKAYPAETRGA